MENSGDTDVLIELMYLELLSRSPDKDGATAIRNEMRDANSFFRVMNEFIRSDEVIARKLSTDAMAGLYRAFAKTNPRDAALQRALRDFLSSYFGKRPLRPLKEAPRASDSVPYVGSFWLSKSSNTVLGWLLVDGAAKEVTVTVNVQNREPWVETFPVDGNIILVRIPLREPTKDNYSIFFDHQTHTISLRKMNFFKEQLFCAEYFAENSAESSSNLFQDFLGRSVTRETKFNPFHVMHLQEMQRHDFQRLLEAQDLSEAPFLQGIIDVEYAALRANLPAEQIVQHAASCIMRDEWIDFHPLLVRSDFEGHDHETLPEWLERLSDPSQSLVGLTFERFSPVYYRHTCDSMMYENELVDYLYNTGAIAGEPHPFCNTSYAAQRLPNDFAWPRRGIWSDSFVVPGKYDIAFSPFWKPLNFQHEATHGKSIKPDAGDTPLDIFLHHPHGLPPSPYIVPSGLAYSFSDRPLEECGPGHLDGHDIVAALECALLSRTAAVSDPKLSICILNFDKDGLSILSAIAAARTTRHDVQVIVLDNGSSPGDFLTIRRYTENLGNIEVVRSTENLYFGEGNNILMDLSRADLLMFLNNDAFVGPTMVDEMIDHLDTVPDSSAVGPTFLFPDLEIQEAGGTITNCGRQVQLNKHTSFAKHRALMPRVPIEGVQYISAACFCIRRSVIDDIGGFDHIYDPFYFEDADLCKRMGSLGYRIDLLPGSFVIHYENASTREFLSNDFVPLIERNRLKFQERWLYSNPGFRPRRLLSELTAEPDPARGTAVVCMPFDMLSSDGDEDRYMLSCALALGATYNVLFCTDRRISRTRLSFAISDAGIEAQGLGSLRPCLIEDIVDRHDVEVMVSAGTGIVPPVPMRASTNIHYCRYLPGPRVDHPGTSRIDAVDAYFVGGALAGRRVDRDQRMTGHDIPVILTGTPIARPDDLAGEAPARTGAIHLLSAGRFEPQVCGERWDIAIDVFRRFHARYPESSLSLTGSGDETDRCRVHIGQLKEDAEGLPVTFHTAPYERSLHERMQEADVYFDTDGYGTDARVPTGRMENGATRVLEAIARGAVPLVYDQGEPAEIVRRSGAGYTFGSPYEAMSALNEITRLDADERAELASRMRAFAASYFDAQFQADIDAQVRKIVGTGV